MYRPPEVSVYELSKGKIGCQWSCEADVWAPASVVSFQSGPSNWRPCYLNTEQCRYVLFFSIQTRGELFPFEGNLDNHLVRTVELAGPAPDTWHHSAPKLSKSQLDVSRQTVRFRRKNDANTYDS